MSEVKEFFGRAWDHLSSFALLSIGLIAGLILLDTMITSGKLTIGILTAMGVPDHIRMSVVLMSYAIIILYYTADVCSGIYESVRKKKDNDDGSTVTSTRNS